MGHQNETEDDDWDFDEDDLEDAPEQLEYCEDCGELIEDCVCDQLDDYD